MCSKPGRRLKSTRHVNGLAAINGFTLVNGFNALALAFAAATLSARDAPSTGLIVTTGLPVRVPVVKTGLPVMVPAVRPITRTSN